MPASFSIHPRDGLVIARFWGIVTFDEMIASARDYAGHRDFRPDQNMVLDLAGYEGTEGDIVGLMQTLARVGDHIPNRHPDQMVIYVAPGDAAQRIAQTVVKSVAAYSGMLPRVVREHAEAFSILGLPPDRFRGPKAIARDDRNV